MENKIVISRNFRTSIIKVVLAISLFFIFYLFLMTFAVALLIGCGYIAVMLIGARINFLTIAAGAGLLAVGIMFFVFLIKFMFSPHKNEDPNRILIHEENHPRLFSLIKEVANKVGTKFPRRVYLRHDVNAGVIYNSSFWSLIFPVRKNLQIGMGLINSINVGEFKAILAHEFGHFSQRSMRLGSYVYTVNHVIFNLVYDYDYWDKTLGKLGRAGGFFGLFILLAYKMAEAVRFLLAKAYNLINIPYMGLSREMEFHADQIAARIAGADTMISALRRTEFSDAAFDQMYRVLSRLSKDKKIVDNIYVNHSFEIQRLSNYFKLRMDHGFPVISDHDLEVNTFKSRINIKDQWASHPSREDREKYIRAPKIDAIEEDTSSCWALLGDDMQWQQKMTSNLYQVDFGNLEGYSTIDHKAYVETVESEISRYKIDDVYQGFYDSRYLFIVEFDRLEVPDEKYGFEATLAEVYNRRTKAKFEKAVDTQSDLEVLQQIGNKSIAARFFEFDHVRYRRKDVAKVMKKVEQEMEQLKNELTGLEQKAMRVNLAVAGSVSEESRNELVNLWKLTYKFQSQLEKHHEMTDRIRGYQYVIYNKPRWHEEELSQLSRDLSNFESDYKALIKNLRLELSEGITSEHRKILDTYLKGNTSYIKLSSFDIEGFNNFASLIYDDQELIYEVFMQKLKAVTDFQKSLYEKLNFSLTREKATEAIKS